MLREGSRSRGRENGGTETGNRSGMEKAPDSGAHEAALDISEVLEARELRLGLMFNTNLLFASLIWGSVGIGYSSMAKGSEMTTKLPAGVAIR